MSTPRNPRLSARDAQAMCDELNQLLTTNDLGALLGDRVVMDVKEGGDEGHSVGMVAEALLAVRAKPKFRPRVITRTAVLK